MIEPTEQECQADDLSETCLMCKVQLELPYNTVSRCKDCENPYCCKCKDLITEMLDRKDPLREVRGKKRGFVCHLCYQELKSDFVVDKEDDKEDKSSDSYRYTPDSDSSFSADTCDESALVEFSSDSSSN
jgi:hypothetical protein